MSLRNIEIKLSPRNAQKLDSYATIRNGKRCRKVAISITPAQLDDLEKAYNGHPNKLATVDEALRVQVLIESILSSN